MRPLVIAWKELLQLRRDRLTLAMMVVLPILQLMLFGYAINTDVRHIPTLIYDQDWSAESRDLARRMEATGFYDIVGYVKTYDEVSAALRSGRARAALVVPPDLASHMARRRPTTIQLVVDGSDPQTVASATNTAASLVAELGAELSVAASSPTGARPSPSSPVIAPLGLEPTTWYNPDLRTAVYVVPGLVGVILTMTTVMLTSMAVVRERERGTLEQLIVSPIRPVELIVGKILPYVAMGYVQMTVILVAGSWIFRVPLVGSMPLLYLLAFVFISANLALGLFFSTLAKTQQQAMQMSFFFFLPNVLLSGFMFPFEAMPRPAQWLSQGLPLTHFLRIVRGIVLKGATFADIASEFVSLAIILGALILLASLRFSKKLD
ncbi:MAG TPA: ABC transporter permease [Polyangiaceae bacterium]|jgi:ABC-2 type transport system permease protein